MPATPAAYNAQTDNQPNVRSALMATTKAVPPVLSAILPVQNAQQAILTPALRAQQAISLRLLLKLAQRIVPPESLEMPLNP